MFTILNSKQAPDLVNQLRKWFEQEWGELDPIVGDKFPEPLLAIDEAGELIGGLAFTTAPEPAGLGAGVWINALLVAPEHRGRGIASKLIQAAESLARDNINSKRLFVYTDVPALYVKNR